MHNKRGLSAIITTLLVILLVLVAVGIVWGVVRNIIREGAEEVSLGKFTLKAEITSANIDSSVNNVTVTVERNPGKGELTGIKFIFYDGINSEIITRTTTLEELGSETFILHLADLIVDDLLEISIVPVFKSSTGKELLGNILATYDVQEGTSIVYECGDGSCNGGETCSTCETDCGVCGVEEYCGDGSCNGGETCSTCETDCGVCGVGEYCGDGFCNGDEICDTCETDCGVCPSDCGNLGIDVGEECDGGANCLGDCTCESGFVSTNPLSLDCEINPSAVCGDGTFDSENEQCDGGANCILPGQLNECTCPDGHDPDEVGGCTQRLALITGTVDEVWPIGSVMYFASDSLPTAQGTDITYSSWYYVKFPGSAEINCVLIANYILPFGDYTRAHIAFNYEVEIVVGNTYEIWGDSTCM